MKRASGFTLLELLIGLTLLGFMLALLFGSFRLAVKSWDAVETNVQHDGEQHAAILLLRRLLSTMAPLRHKRLPGQPLMFAGWPDRLVLVAPLTEQLGLRMIELAIEPQEGKAAPAQRLILRDAPPPYESSQLADPGSEAGGRPLIEGLQDAGFRFFGSLKPGEPAQWHDAWESAEELPALVHVRLTRRNDDPVDLVVAPLISADRAALVRITAGPPQ